MAGGAAEVKAVVPFVIVTLIWLAVGAVGPFFVKGPNASLIRTMLVLIAICCWLFWLCSYLVQLNPLMGPGLRVDTLKEMIELWGRRA